jgi:putative ubiquitin-RnfH superfamily antitoxin RatB of RatAB toxin-antitoxin module
MPKKSTPKATPKSPGLDTREADWKQRISTFAIEHDASVAEAEQRQALLQGLSATAKQVGVDLKAATASRKAAFEKVVASLKPFLAAPKEGKK